MEFGKDNWRTFEQGVQREWLLTNGIGGFASSTVIGANTRRYHGLLVAALKPPVMRHLILSKLDESIIISNTSYSLYSNKTHDHINAGYVYQQRFSMEPLPLYIYSVEDVIIHKKICLVNEENQVVIMYKVKSNSANCKLKITPLINFRDYHFNSNRSTLGFEQTALEDGSILKPSNGDIKIFINISEGRYIKEDNLYFYNMDYLVERERGLHSIEDHYIPGFFEVDIKPNESKTIFITAGIGEKINLDGKTIINDEETRIYSLIDNVGCEDDDFETELVKSSDHFIVKRDSIQSKTIIAGYPWFTDWGRDTMIALPGLTLATRRYEDAKEILYTFSRYIKNGLIPNMFPDSGQEPVYNTVDAALWYINAIHSFIRYTSNYQFVQKYLFEGMRRIISSYEEGTINNIKMDDDGLIYAGDPDTQLTWMDAKVGDWVVTPRHGKAVEINALWYNALNIMAYISKRFGYDDSKYIKMAEKVFASFNEKFWNEKKNCLLDFINEEGIDEKIRPNQIFAVSLDYEVIKGERAKNIVSTVRKHLYTSYGIRSLAPCEKEYVGIYEGDQHKRDGAYHQGTAWSWLMGHFITAYVKVNNYSRESKDEALDMIDLYQDHLRDACIGSVSEIFDGNDMNIPRGCFAQAWGVAEILRVYSQLKEKSL
jgi:predicted glycogen debranching enzyme